MHNSPISPTSEVAAVVVANGDVGRGQGQADRAVKMIDGQRIDDAPPEKSRSIHRLRSAAYRTLIASGGRRLFAAPPCRRQIAGNAGARNRAQRSLCC